MGIKSWIERKGSIGGTARAVAIACRECKKKQPELVGEGFGEYYIDFRYNITGGNGNVGRCLQIYQSYTPCPINLAWAILQNENYSNLDYVESRKIDWIPMMREEIHKLGINPDQF
jgi:hypothetical protein